VDVFIGWAATSVFLAGHLVRLTILDEFLKNVSDVPLRYVDVFDLRYRVVDLVDGPAAPSRLQHVYDARSQVVVGAH
jgi:hypothetical protein